MQHHVKHGIAMILHMLTSLRYIERSDFQLKPDDDFFGLGPGKEALLKYFYNFKCEKVVKDAKGEVTSAPHCYCQKINLHVLSSPFKSSLRVFALFA
jgi:hypothetical protein